MGNELLRIAEGFSIIDEGLRGLAKAEGGTKDKSAVKAQKQDAVKLKNLKKLLEQGLVLEDGEFTEADIGRHVYGVRVYEDHFD